MINVIKKMMEGLFPSSRVFWLLLPVALIRLAVVRFIHSPRAIGLAVLSFAIIWAFVIR